MPGQPAGERSRISEQNISFYNEIAANYDHIIDQENSNKVIREKVATKFKDIVKAGSVLDFGGGTGRDLEWLANNNYNIIFCEPSAAMRAIAIENSKNILPAENIFFLDKNKADFRQWNTELPFSQKTDAILCNFAVINCIPDIESLFKNLALVIKPGGHLIALVLDKRYSSNRRSYFRNRIASFISGKPVRIYVQYKDQRQTVYIYTLKQIKKAAAAWFDFYNPEPLQGSGFTLIHLTRK